MSRVLYEVAEQGVKLAGKQIGEALSKKGTTELLERSVKQGIEEIGGTKVSPQSLNVLKKVPDPENIDTLIKGTKGPDSEDAYEGLNGLLHNGEAGNKALDDLQAQDGLQSTINGKAIDPKVLAAKTAERIQGDLETLTANAQARLQGAEPTEIPTAKGPQQQILYPGDKEELLPQIQEYIKLREDLHNALVKSGKNPKDTKLIQSKKGWQNVFGNVVDEEGWPMRVTGGQKGSPASWQKNKHGVARASTLNKLPGSLDRESNIRGWGADNPKLKDAFEGHHWSTASKEAELFTKLEDGSMRPDEDLDYIFGTLEKDGIHMADHSKNLVAESVEAHRGAKARPASLQLGAHPQLRKAYDIEGIGNYMEEASDIQFTIPKSAKGQNRRPVWLTNNQGIFVDPKTNKVIGDLTDVKKKYGGKGGKGVKAVRFKLYKGGSTYLAGQKHGMSEQLLRLIQHTEDPEDVVSLIRLYESLIGPKRRGTATLAHYSMHGADPMGGPGGKVVDEQSKQMFAGAQGEMLEVMEDLRQLPGFNTIPEFRAVAKSFEEVTKEVTEKVQ